MFYVDSLQSTFEITLTLGEQETVSVPPLAIRFTRKGTNETDLVVVPAIDVTTGERYITISNLSTSVFDGTGEYQYIVYDYTTPSAPVEIEQGLCVVTTTSITKTTYGTDKQRSEYKGHI